MSTETWVSIASALFAGASAVFTGLQIRDSRRAAKVQAEDARKVAEAAERSARAAEDSATIAKSALEVGRRAWITVRSLLIQHRDPGSAIPVSVLLCIHNGGVTPAVDVRGAFKLFEAQTLPAELPAMPQVDLGTIGAGNSLERSIQPENNMLANPGVQSSIKNKELWLYLSVLIKYRDTVFGDEHASAALYIYRPESQSFTPWGGDKFNDTN
jgi:hypothetical protein